MAPKDIGDTDVAPASLVLKPDSAPAILHPVHAWWTVSVLMSLQTLSLLDRHILSLMIIEVRKDLALNDFEVGLLQGLAFTASFCIAGLFIGVLADRHPAKRILYICTTVWSLAAAACGVVQNYWGMMAARMMTGVGEGGVIPSAQALIASLFPKKSVSLPMSLFAVSGALGIGLAYICGGVLLEVFTTRSVPGLEAFAPWRQVLIVTALPGLLIAFLSFTLLESRPLAKSRISTAESWHEIRRFLSVERQLFARLAVGYGLTVIACYAVFSWAPTYARRVLELSPAEVGIQMGLISTIGGIPAAGLYGYIVDRRFARGQVDFVLRAFPFGAMIAVPVCVLGFTLNQHAVFIAAVIAVQCLLSAALGPATAALQMATPPEMRGRMAALFVAVSIFAGYAIGPMVIGALTEFLFVDPQKVGHSIALTVLVCGPIAAWSFWSARPYFVARLSGSTLGHMRRSKGE